MFYENYPLIKRSTKPVYKREIVLSTELMPFSGVSKFIDLMADVKKECPDAWYLRCKIWGFDRSADVVRVVPTIINSFNKSRILRREKISGLRLCNLKPDSRGRVIYTTDLIVNNTFSAECFVSAFRDFLHLPQACTIYFRNPPQRNKAAFVRVLARASEKFWRRTKLNHDYLTIIPNEVNRETDPLNLGLPSWRVESNFMHIALSSILDVLRTDIHSIEFGSGSKGMLEISRFCPLEASDYDSRDIDKILDPARYRRFSAFGRFCKDPHYIVY